MLAAAVPVIAYDAPGRTSCSRRNTVSRSARSGTLADRVCDLFTDPDRLREARFWARDRVASFDWGGCAWTPPGCTWTSRPVDEGGRPPRYDRQSN